MTCAGAGSQPQRSMTERLKLPLPPAVEQRASHRLSRQPDDHGTQSGCDHRWPTLRPETREGASATQKGRSVWRREPCPICVVLHDVDEARAGLGATGTAGVKAGHGLAAKRATCS